jgi:hypothetical protein
MPGPQIIFPDVDEVCYNLKGNLIPVPDLSDKQLEIGYYRTFETLGNLSRKIQKLSVQFERELKVIHAIGDQTEKRGMPAFERSEALHHILADE